MCLWLKNSTKFTKFYTIGCQVSFSLFQLLLVIGWTSFLPRGFNHLQIPAPSCKSVWKENRQIAFKAFGSFSRKEILSPWGASHNARLRPGRPILRSVFYSLETLLNSLRNPLKHLSFKLNKLVKAKEGLSHGSWIRHISGRHIFQDIVPRSQRTPRPSAVLTTAWYLMLTMRHNPIRPCPNAAPPVTSTVNQGRAPLLWDKIREACSAREGI